MSEHAYWHQQVYNPLGVEIARLMDDGRYRQVDMECPAFHYAVRAAMRAPTAEMALTGLLDVFAELEKSHRRTIDHAVELAKVGPPPIIIVKEVDKPQTE